MAETKHALDLKVVLNSLDSKRFNFYNNLTDEEKKGYHPIVLMRYMSSLTNNNDFQQYQILVTNEFVNVGFWSLSKHPELQHQLLCFVGLGKSNQYRPWISKKSKSSMTKVDEFLLEI